jgi:hypothetical protein
VNTADQLFASLARYCEQVSATVAGAKEAFWLLPAELLVQHSDKKV